MTERVVAQRESEVPRMKRIGVIGGFGQWSTLDIVERIFRESVRRVHQYGNRGYPRTIVDFNNRAPMILNPDGSVPELIEPSPEILESARLIGANSDIVILAANTPHLFKKQIEEAAGKPLLSIVDVTVDEAVRRGCKRVGVMAIGPTLERRLYQDPLEQKGIETVALPKNLSERLDVEGIYQIEEGAQPDEVGDITHVGVDYLRKQGVNGIILGCSEIPILLGDNANDPDIINPSQLLAEAAVKKALSK